MSLYPTILSKSRKMSALKRSITLWIVVSFLPLASPHPGIFSTIQPVIAAENPPTSGDWVIASGETWIHQDKIIFLNGSLVVESGGSLTLHNVTLQLNCATPGEHNITVEGGGALTIEAKSVITAYDPANPWLMEAKAHSTILFDDSLFSHAGWNHTYKGVIIKNKGAIIVDCTFQDNFYGLLLESAEDAVITNNLITNNKNVGVEFSLWCSNNTFSGNTITRNGAWGIGTQASSTKHNITSNTIAYNDRGIFVYSTTNNTYSENIIVHNSFAGIELGSSSDPAAYVANHTFSGNIIVNNTYGVHSYGFAYNNTFSGNAIADSGVCGIWLEDSDNNEFSGNNITDSTGDSLFLYNASNTIISDNRITNSFGDGIRLKNTRNNHISWNSITNSSSNGIHGEDTANEVFTSNNITKSAANGISLSSSRNCTFYANIMTNSGRYGLFLGATTQDCLLWRNTLATNNVTNAYDNGSSNQWDDGWYGNWYDDYSGPDLDLNHIGDDPYPIPGAAGAQDRYPLMTPYDHSGTDLKAPLIDSPPDKSFEEGSVGHSILWRPKDYTPKSYFIYRNISLVEQGTWYGTTITILLEALPVGTYRYTLVVYDIHQRFARDTVLVTVIASVPPTIDSPPDISYEVGSLGHNITWHPNDSSPASYTLYCNGILVGDRRWYGSAITIGIEDLPIGTYSYTIVVSDQNGNSISDTVIVTVTKGATTTSETAENDSLNNDSLILLGGALLGLGTLLGGALLFIRRRR